MPIRRRSAFAVPSGFCVSRVKVRTTNPTPRQGQAAPSAAVGTAVAPANAAP